MKKVISYSLWGQSPQYTINMIKNVEFAKQYFPDWVCRIYTAPSVPLKIIKELKNKCELIMMDEDEGWNGMFWRFYTPSDPSVDVCIVRDCDSHLNYRDKAAVDAWLSSDKMFHIMRDHGYHSVKIMGGMWGVKKGLLNDIKTMIDEYSRKKINNRKNIDQEFLAEKIYPLVKQHSLVHDIKNRYSGEKMELFPIPRKDPKREFIDNKILEYLNSTIPSERHDSYKQYDDYDNDYIGRIENLTQEDFKIYGHLLNEI